MRTKVKKRKYKIVNKFKFIRFILCVLLFIWSINTLILNLHSKINENCIEIENEIIYLDDTINNNTISETKDDVLKNVIKKPDNLKEEYFNHVKNIALDENIPMEVILAIMTIENQTYNVNISNKNINGTVDIGLCQINSAYVDYFAKKYNIKNLDPYDAYDSILFVAKHMKYLSDYSINKYNLSKEDSYIFAAGAYNRGLGNECKYRNMYEYKEKFINTYKNFIIKEYEI